MAQEQDLQLNPAPEENSGGKKKLIIIVVAVLLVVGIAVGVTITLMGGGSSSAEEESATQEEASASTGKGMPMYFRLKPEFIVNYQVGTRQRFLQVYMEVMTRDPAMMEELETHSPMLRNAIIQIMGEQNFEELRSNEGRIKLRDLLTAEVKRLMQQETGKETIEQVLFTNYVMQ